MYVGFIELPFTMKILPIILIVLASSLADDYLQNNINFSSDVYKELLKLKSGNFLVCPLSAQIILSLLTLGAQGNTLTELRAGLKLPANLSEGKVIFDRLSSKIDVTTPYQLKSANKIYVADGFTIKESYKSVAINTYKSPIESINFNDNERAANHINSWIAAETKDKIKNLVDKRSLSSDIITVLVNAMYFHGFWLKEFGSPKGHKAPFYVSPTKTVNVEVFGGRNNFNYYDNKKLNARFLEMPFVGNEVTMTYVLPNEKDALEQLENSISEVLEEQPYQKYDVRVQFPKFKMETSVDFKTILKSLGVHEAFTSANFKAMSNERVAISEILQKSFIEVNERGATAASATAVFRRIASMPKAMFYVNHPHIFFLKHKTHGIHFVGRYSNPETL